MPTIDWNTKVWDKSWPWSKDGDEWDEFAKACGVEYPKWKDSLARAFIIPYLKEASTVLEIGPGHGRWSDLIAPRIPKGTLHLVDLSRNCVEFCKKRFAHYGNVKTWVNNGKTLELIESTMVDFLFSFDTFVHIEEPEVRAYAREMFRVLKPQAMGVIHHVGNPTPDQRKNGARSQVGARLFREIMSDAGFFVIRQTDEWAGGNVKLSGDTISVFAKP